MTLSRMTPRLRSFVASLCLAFALLLGARPPVQAAEPIKVAFVYVGPVGDGGAISARARPRDGRRRR